MTDRIDAITLLKKATDIIEHCDYEQCGKCSVIGNCNCLITRCEEFLFWYHHKELGNIK